MPPGACSNLHSLFGSSAAPAASVQSLCFQRPVQPSAAPLSKPQPPPTNTQAEATTAESAGSTTLHAALVQIFRSVNGSWQPSGQGGLAVVGGPLPKPFQIVLYEPSTKRAFSTTTVSPDSCLAPPSTQYITLTDDQQASASRTPGLLVVPKSSCSHNMHPSSQNGWSIYFAHVEELVMLLQHVTIVRALRSAMGGSPSKLVTQDVLTGEGCAVQLGDVLAVQFTAYEMPSTPRCTPVGSRTSPLGEAPPTKHGKWTVGGEHPPLSSACTGCTRSIATCQRGAELRVALELDSSRSARRS